MHSSRVVHSHTLHRRTEHRSCPSVPILLRVLINEDMMLRLFAQYHLRTPRERLDACRSAARTCTGPQRSLHAVSSTGTMTACSAAADRGPSTPIPGLGSPVRREGEVCSVRVHTLSVLARHQRLVTSRKRRRLRSDCEGGALPGASNGRNV